MCGIFGIISPKNINYTDLRWLAKCAKQRGKDSSGLIYKADENYIVERENNDIIKLLDKHKNLKTNILFGHSRLITNGLGDNQPVVKAALKPILIEHRDYIIKTYCEFPVNNGGDPL